MICPSWVSLFSESIHIYHANQVQALCVENGSVYVREQILLTISTANDIATDLLIISIPLFLLTRVKLEMKRKLVLGAVLCLSVFMMIIATIRYTLCSVQGRDHSIPDSIWLFFWQSVECFVAICMVSLTAFRSLYGQAKKSRSRYAANYINVSHSEDRQFRKQSPDSTITKSVNIDVTSETAMDQELQYVEKPSNARIALRRGDGSFWAILRQKPWTIAQASSWNIVLLVGRYGLVLLLVRLPIILDIVPMIIPWLILSEEQIYGQGTLIHPRSYPSTPILC